MDNNYQQTSYLQPQQANMDSVPPPVQPVPESPNTHPWLKWVLIILIVTLLSSGATYFIVQSQSTKKSPEQISQVPPTPIPDPTANWKTYTSQLGKYSIKYPPNVVPEEEIIDGGDTPFILTTKFTFNKEEKGCYPHQYPGVILSVSNVPVGIQIRDALNKGYAGLFIGEPEKLNDTLIQNKQALRGSAKSSTNAYEEDAYVINNDELYAFTFCTALEYSIEHKNLFDQMLSTFKFTDSTDATANWQTYTNAVYGFSIRYPLETTWVIYPEHITKNKISIIGIGNQQYEGGKNILLEISPQQVINQKDYIIKNIAPNSDPKMVSTVNINGISAQKWSFNSATGEDNYAIFLNRNNKTYILIKELINKDNFIDYSNQIDQILSTFRFVP